MYIVSTYYFLGNNLVFSKALSATDFRPHARTLAPWFFARTHFARTCAFYLVAPRTRTRTSKLPICTSFYSSLEKELHDPLKRKSIFISITKGHPCENCFCKNVFSLIQFGIFFHKKIQIWTRNNNNSCFKNCFFLRGWTSYLKLR